MDRIRVRRLELFYASRPAPAARSADALGLSLGWIDAIGNRNPPLRGRSGRVSSTAGCPRGYPSPEQRRSLYRRDAEG
jgi:hypothetical protein